ncbi:unnamed protein product [Pedinophyceae sp. YPF-701]|nr:unnamed protein product [Pedinophyceae sp. YPF-701]
MDLDGTRALEPVRHVQEFAAGLGRVAKAGTEMLFGSHQRGAHVNLSRSMGMAQAGIALYSPKYYGACSVGGMLACGLTHMAVTPLDVVKCNMQVSPDKYRSIGQGFRKIVRDSGVEGLFKGASAALTGYAAQGACKFGLYEVFKKKFADAVGPEAAEKHKPILFLVASASAEFFADIALCPFEAVKVRIQTIPGYAKGLFDGLPKAIAQEGVGGLYKGLGPLWGRQIPYTMVKFGVFEATVDQLYKRVVPKPKSQCTKAEQLGVTFVAGYIAGVFCAAVSQPADNMISIMSSAGKGVRPLDVVAQIGIKQLFLRGLGMRIAMVGTLTGLQWGVYDTFKVAIGLPTSGGGVPAKAPEMELKPKLADPTRHVSGDTVDCASAQAPNLSQYGFFTEKHPDTFSQGVFQSQQATDRPAALSMLINPTAVSSNTVAMLPEHPIDCPPALQGAVTYVQDCVTAAAPATQSAGARRPADLTEDPFDFDVDDLMARLPVDWSYLDDPALVPAHGHGLGADSFRGPLLSHASVATEDLADAPSGVPPRTPCVAPRPPETPRTPKLPAPDRTPHVSPDVPAANVYADRTSTPVLDAVPHPAVLFGDCAPDLTPLALLTPVNTPERAAPALAQAPVAPLAARRLPKAYQGKASQCATILLIGCEDKKLSVNSLKQADNQLIEALFPAAVRDAGYKLGHPKELLVAAVLVALCKDVPEEELVGRYGLADVVRLRAPGAKMTQDMADRLFPREKNGTTKYYMCDGLRRLFAEWQLPWPGLVVPAGTLEYLKRNYDSKGNHKGRTPYLGRRR